MIDFVCEMMRKSMISLGFATLLYMLPTTVISLSDTLTTSSRLYDGETLISAGGVFAFGFFSPNSNSSGGGGKRYAAIWYHKIASHDVVWVANGGKPVSGHLGSIALSPNGTLVLFDHNTTVIIWSSCIVSKTNASSSPTAQLLDTGNLIVTAFVDDNEYIWQSFDYPSDTMLPGMFIGLDRRTGLNLNVTSWASPTDPSPGEYAIAIDLRGIPQLVVTHGHNLYFRGGMYRVGNFGTGGNGKVGYYYQPENGEANAIWMLKMMPNGKTLELTWIDPPGQWIIASETPMDQCDLFSLCGPFGVCNTNNSSSYCSCVPGFRPKNLALWEQRNWRDGCVRNTTLDCRNGTGTDGYISVRGLKIPDTSAAVMTEGSLNSDGCRRRCLTNCSCTAYSLVGSSDRCVMWTGELNDIRIFPGAGNKTFQDEFFVRVAATNAAAAAAAGAISSQNDNKVKSKSIFTTPITWILFIVIILFCGCLIVQYIRRKKRTHRKSDEVTSDNDIDLPLYDFETIVEATNNFSDMNKLGEGGFGTVYKGKQKDGKEIAVKRLSNSSKQGTNEFKSEVMSIAKLQHRNLVLLLGCCIQRQERILIYEYMANKSLDTFLFDKEKKMLLNWKTRYNIIIGIARGLLYLHQDSAVRVIHRDLKAGNILLNQEMVPKISDFGLARIFGGDEAKSETKRVVGTYGYMSPEYLKEGIFSTKSDVFSFGVIVLEVISNQRNKGYPPSQSNNHLIEHAWILWNEGKSLELVDESISNSFSISEVLRFINIGLLCVQECTDDRPLMSSVILMLTSEQENLPEPKRPGFVSRRYSFKEDHSSSIKQEINSINEVSLTTIDGR